MLSSTGHAHRTRRKFRHTQAAAAFRTVQGQLAATANKILAAKEAASGDAGDTTCMMTATPKLRVLFHSMKALKCWKGLNYQTEGKGDSWPDEMA
jgi:hypothetical protein